MRVFENSVLRRISIGRKRKEVTGKRRRLAYEELIDPYSSTNIIRMTISRIMRWVGQVAGIGERKDVYRVLVGKHEEKRPLGRLRHR